MRRLRIFLSSPSDVGAERLRTHLIVQKLARDYARFFQIETFLWEYEPMLASGHFQDAIDLPSRADIVILVVWSRLGTPLPERTRVREYRGLDGRAPVTGTEWEFENALAANQSTGAPDLIAYRRTDDPGATLVDPARRELQIHQYEALEEFWQRHFENRGVFLAASKRYATVEEFDRYLEADLKKLIERRIKEETRAGAGSSGSIWLKGSPFRGLTTYQFDDAAIFFGRDGATRSGLSRLAEAAARKSAFLLVSGASGSGKSSLARAGLLPALVAPKAVPQVGFWRRAVMRPSDGGDDPFLALAGALANGSPEKGEGLPELLGPGMTAPDLARHLRSSADDPSYLFEKAIREITEVEHAKGHLLQHEQARLVLLVDQLEELFTRRGIAASERALFIRLLAGLARTGVVWVIATMRSDLHHLANETKEFVALVESGAQIALAAPGQAELLEIIRQPAAAAGLSFETDPQAGIGLDGAIVGAAAAEPGVLPLLSVVLDTLYERDVAARAEGDAPGRVLTFATYRALGELKGAVAQRAEEIFRRLEDGDPQAAAAFPEVLRALVTTSDGTAVTACTAAMDNFPAGSPGRRLIEAFLAPEARLLVAQHGARGPEIRLAHEILLSEWPRASRQIADDRRDIETRSRLEGLLHRYQRADRQDKGKGLLDGLSLAEGLDLVERWKIAPTTPLAVFVAASRAAARWKRQRFLAASIVLMVVFAGLAAAASWQWRVAAIQTANALVSEEAARRNEELAKLKAQESEQAARVAAAESKRADDALQRRLADEADRVAAVAHQLIGEGRGTLARALVLQVAPRLTDAADRPLTPSLASALGRSLRMNREVNRRVPDGNNVLRLAVTADEKTAVTGLNNGTIQIWDLPGLVLRKNVKVQSDVVSSLEISPDQSSVLVAGDKVPSVWDLHTGEKRFDLAVPNPVKFIKMALYSPDGAVIATGGGDNRALLFDARDGRLLREIPGPEFKPAYERARKRAAERGEDFGIADPIVVAVAEASFKIFGATTDIAFSPDGTMLAVTGPSEPEGAVRIYDVATGALRATAVGTEFSLMGGVMGYGERLQFSESGNRLVAVAPTDNIQIFETTKGTLQRVLTTFETETIVLSRDGRLLISGHRDGSLTFWCVSNGQLLGTLRTHRASIEHLKFNANETLLLSTSDDNTSAVWLMPTTLDVCSRQSAQDVQNRLKSMKPIATFEGHFSNVNRAAFLAKDQRLLTVSRDGSLRHWSVPERGIAALLPTGEPKGGAMWEDRWQQHLLFAAGAGTLIINGVSGNRATLWDVGNHRPIATVAGDRVAAARSDGMVSFHDTPFTATVVDPKLGDIISKNANDDDTRFLFAPSDWYWEISPDARRAIGTRAWLKYFKKLKAAGISPNGNDTDDDDTGLFDQEKEPRILIDTATGKELAELKVEGFRVERAGFSADGRLILAVMLKGTDYSERMVAVWDAQAGRLLGQTPTSKGAFEVARSEDARTILLFRSSGVDERNYQLAGNVLFRLGSSGLTPVKLAIDREENRAVLAAVVSPDGHLVAAGHHDGSILVWNAASGELLANVDAGSLPLDRLAISPDGNFIAAADRSHTIWIIDRRTRSIVASPTFMEPVVEMRFAPGNRQLIALVRGGTAFVIDLSPLPGFDGDFVTLVDWGRATKLEEISAADRRRYGVDPPPLFERTDLDDIKPFAVSPRLARGERTDELAQCDALAADPFDRDRPANGVEARAIDLERAMAACLAALSKAPDDPRIMHQYARVLAQAGRVAEALSYYKRAADLGYGAAMRAIADILDGDKDRLYSAFGEAFAWYERAAAAGDPSALLAMAVRKASASYDSATIRQALSMALAAGRQRLSAAAMSIGQRIDNQARDPAGRKLALFYMELGLWIADHVKQSTGADDDELSLRTAAVSRVRNLADMLPPKDMVRVYRAARDWRPDHPAESWD